MRCKYTHPDTASYGRSGSRRGSTLSMYFSSVRSPRGERREMRQPRAGIDSFGVSWYRRTQTLSGVGQRAMKVGATPVIHFKPRSLDNLVVLQGKVIVATQPRHRLDHRRAPSQDQS